MKLTLLTTLSIGALLPLVAMGGERVAGHIQESASALTLVPAQDEKPVAIAKPGTIGKPAIVARPAAPAMPATLARPALVARPRTAEIPEAPLPSGLRRLRVATSRSAAPPYFARAPRALRSYVQEGLLSQQGSGVSASSGNGVLFGNLSGSTVLLVTDPGSYARVHTVAAGDDSEELITVGEGARGLFGIVTSTCCEGSDCCESDDSGCDEGRVSFFNRNGQFVFDGDEDARGLRSFISPSTGQSEWRNEWQEEFEELHEEQLEMMADLFEEWEDAFLEQMEVFEETFEEMDEPAFDEMELHFEDFESRWEDARDEWEESWDDQWEEWEEKIEDAWEERGEAQAVAPYDRWAEAAERFGAAAELHGVQSEEFGRGLTDFMHEYQGLIGKLHEGQIRALLPAKKSFFHDDKGEGCEESQRRRRERVERELWKRENLIEKAQQEADRSVMEMHRAEQRAQRELHEANLRMAEFALQLQEQAARAAAEGAAMQGLKLHERNQAKLPGLHRRKAELEGLERKLLQEATRQLSDTALEEALHGERMGGNSKRRNYGSAPRAESDEALGQLQDLVSEMHSSIESLRSDLRDLRDRVDALSKREFH